MSASVSIPNCHGEPAQLLERTDSFDCVFAGEAALGECPRWDERRALLWWLSVEALPVVLGLTWMNRWWPPGWSPVMVRRIVFALLLGLIVVYPIGKLLYNSFFDMRLSGGAALAFVGRRNYLDALQDPDFWNATKNTLLITLITVPGAFLAGLPLALPAAARSSTWVRFRGCADGPVWLAIPHRTASKAAISGISRALARELGEHNIRVEPSRVAGMALLLASDRSMAVTRQSVIVDAGLAQVSVVG